MRRLLSSHAGCRKLHVKVCFACFLICWPVAFRSSVSTFEIAQHWHSYQVVFVRGPVAAVTNRAQIQDNQRTVPSTCLEPCRLVHAS